MGRPIRAGIDLDGVCYRWSETAKFLLNTTFGYKLGESTYWGYIQANVKPEHWKWLWADAITKHGLFRHGNCYPGTFMALQALHEMGHDLVIITSRPKLARADTLDWLAYHRIPASEVHILGEDAPKNNVACDYYVDDGPQNAEPLVRAGRAVFLWDRPWNQGCQYGIRISTWPELIRYVHGLGRKAVAA